MTTTTSCPACGDGSRPGRQNCGSCGYAFVDEPGTTLPGPSARSVGRAAVAAGAALALLLAVLALRPGDDPPPLPDPVSARAAEAQLEDSLFSLRDDDSAAVACPREITPSSATRCRVRYPNGSVRRVFVRVSPVGTLEILTP